MRFGYGRVSTRDQHPDSQRDRLEAAGCERLFIDHGVSGAKERRPALDELLDHLRPGDEVVVTKLDRLGPSVRHLCDLAARFAAAEVNLVVLDQSLDTGTPAGRLTFHIFGAIAEFERDAARGISLVMPRGWLCRVRLGWPRFAVLAHG